MSQLMEMMRSPATKLGGIALLALLLQVPVLMVSSLVEERQGRQGEVEREFERGWGPAQTVWGPVLVVPYRYLVQVPDKPPVWARGAVQVVPQQVAQDVRLAPETRHRGMFDATVYTADVALRGSVTAIARAPDSERTPEMQWDGAKLVFGVQSARGMGADAAMTVDGTAVPIEPLPRALEPRLPPGVDAQGRETPERACGLVLLSAPVHLAGPGAEVRFESRFGLRGTQAFDASPVGRRAAVSMVSPWPSPSFKEGMMPGTSTVGPEGFSATWDVAGEAGSGLPQDLGAAGPNCMNEAAAGVRLLPAVPTYLMVSRTMKYETLFLLLAFLTYFLFETISGSRIQAVQYGLLGLSMTLFPLILVAVAEPLGFAAGYAVATAAVLAQATLFTWSVTGRRTLAAWFAAVLSGLFGFLYVVLSLESFALLAGTAALFAILSVVMAVTRRIRWSAAPG